MGISIRLSTYLARNFFLAYLAALGILVALKFLRELVDLARKVATRDDVGFDIVFELAALKVPQSIELMTPLSLLAAGMYTMWRLTRHNELVAVRAAGISMWQFLAPALLVAGAIGGFLLVFVNPIGADSLARYDAMYSQHIDSDNKAFRVSSVGAWLREADENGITVIHADRATGKDSKVVLTQPTVLLFDPNGGFRLRIDANSGSLEQGYWHLVNTVSRAPGGRDEAHEFIDLSTGITLDRLKEGVANPASVSFWQLRDVIDLTEKAGFTAVRYRIQWHSLLAMPVLLCALMLVAATFSLRMPRRGGTMLLIVSGITAGFVIELLKYVMLTLGNFGEVPVVLAAWTPAIATLLFGVAVLFHVADG